MSKPLKKLTNTSPMPWGQYKGTKMANVPANYLLYCMKTGNVCSRVKAYINENIDALKSEINNAR